MANYCVIVTGRGSSVCQSDWQLRPLSLIGCWRLSEEVEPDGRPAASLHPGGAACWLRPFISAPPPVWAEPGAVCLQQHTGSRVLLHEEQLLIWFCEEFYSLDLIRCVSVVPGEGVEAGRLWAPQQQQWWWWRLGGSGSSGRFSVFSVWFWSGQNLSSCQRDSNCGDAAGELSGRSHSGEVCHVTETRESIHRFCRRIPSSGE